MVRSRSCRLTAAIVMSSLSLAFGQDSPHKLAFEVATIKPSEPGDLNGGIKPLPGGDGYLAQNVPVRLMISLMYHVPLRQIVGGADWVDADRYDIEAKADHTYTKDDLQKMFRNLLSDRFDLKLHKESREGPVYALMVDKSGAKMKLNNSAQDFKIPMTFGSNNSVIGSRVPMQYLCWWLGQLLQDDKRPVIEKTQLNRNFDFVLTFAPERLLNTPKDSQPPELENLPSIFDALKQQLGLKLERQKGPVDYYIIDHVDKPSPN